MSEKPHAAVICYGGAAHSWPEGHQFALSTCPQCYADAIAMLKAAPPWQAIGDERYRRWQIEALAMVDRVKHDDSR